MHHLCYTRFFAAGCGRRQLQPYLSPTLLVSHFDWSTAMNFFGRQTHDWRHYYKNFLRFKFTVELIFFNVRSIVDCKYLVNRPMLRYLVTFVRCNFKVALTAEAELPNVWVWALNINCHCKKRFVLFLLYSRIYSKQKFQVDCHLCAYNIIWLCTCLTGFNCNIRKLEFCWSNISKPVNQDQSVYRSKLLLLFTFLDLCWNEPFKYVRLRCMLGKER